MNAIYGQLFERSSGGAVEPDLATGYKYSADGLTLTISIRSGVKFSDGTPFTAAAVAAQFQRSLDPANDCDCLGAFSAVTSETASGNDVILKLSRPDYTIPQQIIAQAPDWVPSPSALATEGATAFGQKPVGAGPFKVVSNAASSELVLTRNPLYWQKGLPKLKTLTFINASSDETAYAALQSGSVQLVLGITTPQILSQAKSQYTEVSKPGVVVQELEFDTTKPPFNNPLAREAVAYATDPAEILKTVSPGYGVLSESPTGPGGLLNELTVPGTRTYDLAKAKSLVSQLGGLSFTFLYITSTAIYTTGAQALAQEWEQAGIKVTLEPEAITTYDQYLLTRSWDMLFTAAGGVAPSVGTSTALPEKFGLTGDQTCCQDTYLNGLIGQLAATSGQAAQTSLAHQIYSYINSKEYSIFLFALPTVAVESKSLSGVVPAPNGTAGKELVPWQTVSFS
jgi:peptide/nickel transport system substrate-binding protein